MSEPARFHVKGWAEFQHYRDRRPTWIKLHRTLLDDAAFHRLPLASRALAPMLWLLASESLDGSVSADADFIAFRLRMTVEDVISAVKPLLAARFIAASGTLAECYQDASPEKRQRREETEGEREIAVAPLPPSNGKAETWNQAACRIVTERYGGTAPGGRITKALRPLVGKHGEQAVLAAWARYLDETEAEYLSPERFATTFSHWSGQSRAPTKGKAGERADQIAAEAFGGLKKRDRWGMAGGAEGSGDVARPRLTAAGEGTPGGDPAGGIKSPGR